MVQKYIARDVISFNSRSKNTDILDDYLLTQLTDNKEIF